MTTSSLSVAGLADLVDERAENALWLSDEGLRTWADFGRLVAAARRDCIQAGVRAGDMVVTPGESRMESLAWLFAVAACGGVVAPLRLERSPELFRWQEAVRVDWMVRDGQLVASGLGRQSLEAGQLLAKLRDRGQPGLILGTGGTTGVPKLVLHDLHGLLKAIRVRAGRPLRTLPLMRFDHIGGLDMAWRALAGGQCLVEPPDDLSPLVVAATVARHQVEVMPATPSFLNLLLLAGAERVHDLGSLRVIPYGAEPMPAGLLARLQAAFPVVEFIQRFGSTETGTLPARNVGAGLILDPATPGFEWKIVTDELWIRSPHRALGYLAGDNGRLDQDGWFRTGDLALQRADGAVEILGRQVELINVGGEKVLPAEIEDLLLGHPAVADCRVYGQPNPVLGEIVAADVVWRVTPADALQVKRALVDFFTPHLPRHKLPAVVRLVASVDTTRNLKKHRPNS